MNRNRHLVKEPIIESIKIGEGVIGVLLRCPKCRNIIEKNQGECECGCKIRKSH